MRHVAAFSAVLITVGGYIVVSYAGSRAGRGYNLAWHTFRDEPEFHNLRSKDVQFPSRDGIQLAGSWLPSDVSTPLGIVIMAHGIDGNRSTVLVKAEMLVRAGFDVLDVDLRAHGDSQGSYATFGSAERQDILGAADFLRGLKCSAPLIAFGYSYGAVAALNAAAEDQSTFAAVIADSAFLSADHMAWANASYALHHPKMSRRSRLFALIAAARIFDPGIKFFYKLRTGVELNPMDRSAEAVVRRIWEPAVLFLSSSDDRIASPEDTTNLFRNTRSSRKDLRILRPSAPLLNELTHDPFVANPDEYKAAVLNFSRQYVLQSTSAHCPVK